MFISSMARKNEEKWKNKRVKSKTSSNISKNHGHYNNTVREEIDTDVGLSYPPRSIVGSSDIFLINGAGKKLQTARDLKHISNSAKTIHPISKIKTRSRSVDLGNYSIDRDASNIDKLTPSFSDIVVDEENALMPKESFDCDTNGDSSASFIDTPRDARWYLSPAHHMSLIQDKYQSMSYGDFELGLLNKSCYRINLDNEVESKLDQEYVEKSKIREEEALARAASSSPYELELCRLRKEKLKLEENYLLKKKCEMELERTRDPKPKWYELKTKEFTKEMEKYDNLMNNRNQWNDILDYRLSLSEKSRQLST